MSLLDFDGYPTTQRRAPAIVNEAFVFTPTSDAMIALQPALASLDTYLTNFMSALATYTATLTPSSGALAAASTLGLTPSITRAPSGSSASFSGLSLTPDLAGMYVIDWAIGGTVLRTCKLVCFKASVLTTGWAAVPTNHGFSGQRNVRGILRSLANNSVDDSVIYTFLEHAGYPALPDSSTTGWRVQPMQMGG